MSARWLLVALGCIGCLRPSQERAQRDTEVGKADTLEIAVRVADGLAAVRAIDAERIILWGSAPGFRFTLENRSQGPRSYRIELQNCLPDAELRRDGLSALPEREASISTRKVFVLELAPGSTELQVTTPDADDLEPYQFALMSDVQEAIDRVQDIYARINAETDVRYLLGAGDLTERGTREQLERFQTELTSLRVPYFTTLGNHELGPSPSLYQEYFGRGSFHFDFRGVAFTLIDSASATVDPTVYEWLEGWLDRSVDQTHIVAMHIPPLDPIGVRNGAFASRAEAGKLVARLGRGNVDLTLYGHVHSFYAFDNAGIPAFISGGGGAIPERFDNMGRHFMVIRVGASAGVIDSRVVRVD